MSQSIITVLPMLVCALWAVLLALDLYRRGNRGAHASLLLWAVASTLLYLGHCAFFNRSMEVLPLFDTLYVTTNLMVFPLYLRYLSVLTEGRASLWVSILAFGPSLLVGSAVGMLYLKMDAAETAHFIDAYLYGGHLEGLVGLSLWQGWLHALGRVFFAVGVLLTLVFGFRKVARFNRLIDTLYADSEDKNLARIDSILRAMAATAVAGFVANLLGRHQFADNLLLLALPFVIFSVLLFAVGWCGLQQDFSYADVLALTRDVGEGSAPEEPEPLPPAPLADGGDERARQVSDLIRDEGLFLQPDLHVGHVAARLGTNTRYVQQALNRGMGLSFADLVNQLRTDYAEALLDKDSTLSVEEVAVSSGYKSLSSFYRNFVKYKGRTPRGGQKA